MSSIRKVVADQNTSSFGLDAGQKTRVAQASTFFNGLILNSDNNLLFDNKGTGTHSFNKNTVRLHVNPGEYIVRQSKRFSPYFPGQSQIIELSFDNFQQEGDLIKSVGYFSSSTISPYNTEFDGLLFENNAGNISFKAYNKGILNINIPIEQMLNYDLIQNYDWSNFTALAIDFLWLGGAVIRIFMKLGSKFILLHETDWNLPGTFIESPNQPVRYEVRSITSSGYLTYICSQVSSEGGDLKNSMPGSITRGDSEFSNTKSNSNEIYPLISMRLKQSFKNNIVIPYNFYINELNKFDYIYYIILNPVINGVDNASWISKGCIEYDISRNHTNYLTNGNILYSESVSSVGKADELLNSSFLYLGSSINGIMDELVIGVQQFNGNKLNYYAGINFREI